jgi:hypothetical protein
MRVFRRLLTVLVALASVTSVAAGGWALGRSSQPRTLQAPSSAPAVQVADATGSCTDGLAMSANANLVGQVHDYREKLAVAQRHANDASLRATAAAGAAPTHVVPSRAEWARMARDGKVRLRLPCTSWDTVHAYELERNGSMIRTVNSFQNERTRRAEAAELSSEELDALAEAHQRAHDRTWAAIRSLCETDPGYREWRESVNDEAATSRDRIDVCRGSILAPGSVTTRTALARVIEIQAAGLGSDRASSAEQRVAFALTNASNVLFDEVARTIGRDKAIRAADNGILCFDESVFDLQEPKGMSEGG